MTLRTEEDFSRPSTAEVLDTERLLREVLRQMPGGLAVVDAATRKLILQKGFAHSFGSP